MQSTGAISFDTVLSIPVGRRSGPDAFEGFKLFSNFSMPGTVNCMSDIGETGLLSNSGRSSSGSLVNCDVYWALRASAFSVESLMMMLSGFSTGMLFSSAMKGETKRTRSNHRGGSNKGNSLVKQHK